MGRPFLALLLVVDAGPERTVDGFGGPFDEGLPYEGGALPTPVHPGLFSTSLGHGCDARVLLNLGSVLNTEVDRRRSAVDLR